MLSIISKILKAESSLKSATPVPLPQPIPRRLIAAVRTATATLHTIATPHRRPTPYITRAAAIVAHGAASVTRAAVIVSRAAIIVSRTAVIVARGTATTNQF